MTQYPEAALAAKRDPYAGARARHRLRRRPRRRPERRAGQSGARVRDVRSEPGSSPLGRSTGRSVSSPNETPRHPHQRDSHTSASAVRGRSVVERVDGRVVGLVAVAAQSRPPDGEHQPAAEHGRTQRRADEWRRRSDRSPTPRQHDRHEHEVVQQDAAAEPPRHVERAWPSDLAARAPPRRRPSPARRARARSRSRGPGRRPRAVGGNVGHKTTSSRDPLRLHDPGPVRADEAQRVAVVEVQRLALHLEREQRVGVVRLRGRGRRCGSARRSAASGPAPRASVAHPRSGAGHARARRARSRDALQPSTHAIGRVAVRWGSARSSSSVSSSAVAHVALDDQPVRRVLRRLARHRGGGGPVHREALRSGVGSAGCEQGELAQRPTPSGRR